MNKETILKAVESIEQQTAMLRGLLSQKDEPTTEFLTIHQAAQMMGITVNGVYRLTHMKKIAYYRPTGKRVYFKKADIENYLSQNRVKTETEIVSEFLK